jgi:hypothetical protein
VVLALHIDLPYSITIRFTNFNHCITRFDQLKQYFVQISVTFHFHYFSIYLFAGHSIYSVSVFLVCLIVSKFVSFVCSYFIWISCFRLWLLWNPKNLHYKPFQVQIPILRYLVHSVQSEIYIHTENHTGLCCRNICRFLCMMQTNRTNFIWNCVATVLATIISYRTLRCRSLFYFSGSVDAGTPERCEGKGGRFSWKGTFELIYTKRCLQNIGSWTSPNPFSIYWMIGMWRGSPPGDCAIL